MLGQLVRQTFRHGDERAKDSWTRLPRVESQPQELEATFNGSCHDTAGLITPLQETQVLP